MITVARSRSLPFTPELTEAGLRHRPPSAAEASTPEERRRYDAVRRAAADAALGLGFRRYLTSEGVPFAVRSPPPFSDPDRYDVRLGSSDLRAEGVPDLARVRTGGCSLEIPALPWMRLALVPLGPARGGAAARAMTLRVRDSSGAGGFRGRDLESAWGLSHAPRCTLVALHAVRPGCGSSQLRRLGSLTLKAENPIGVKYSVELGRVWTRTVEPWRWNWYPGCVGGESGWCSVPAWRSVACDPTAYRRACGIHSSTCAPLDPPHLSQETGTTCGSMAGGYPSAGLDHAGGVPRPRQAGAGGSQGLSVRQDQDRESGRGRLLN